MGIVRQSRILMVAGFVALGLGFCLWAIGRSSEWWVVVLAVITGANLGLHVDTVDRQRRRDRREPS